MSTVTKNTKGFKLVHRQTGLSLGEYKDRHRLRYYLSDGQICEDTGFQNIPIQAILRTDGAIGLQRLKPSWGEGELYFLPRATGKYTGKILSRYNLKTRNH